MGDRSQPQLHPAEERVLQLLTTDVRKDAVNLLQELFCFFVRLKLSDFPIAVAKWENSKMIHPWSTCIQCYNEQLRYVFIHSDPFAIPRENYSFLKSRWLDWFFMKHVAWKAETLTLAIWLAFAMCRWRGTRHLGRSGVMDGPVSPKGGLRVLKGRYGKIKLKCLTRGVRVFLTAF